MGQPIEKKRRFMEQYKGDVEPLLRYLPWLERKRGENVSTFYDGEGLGESSMVFPVYESELLNFVKQARSSGLIDKNYVYVYSRYRITGTKQELALIRGATGKDVEILTAVLSKYVCGGMTKGQLWTQAVEEGIFYEILKKFQELFLQ